MLMYFPGKNSIINTDIICMNLDKFFEWLDPGKLSYHFRELLDFTDIPY